MNNSEKFKENFMDKFLLYHTSLIIFNIFKAESYTAWYGRWVWTYILLLCTWENGRFNKKQSEKRSKEELIDELLTVN